MGSNKEFIESKHIENNKNLPTIFGNFEISDYFDIKSKIHKHNFNGVQILKFYFHKNKRWDLHFQNNIVIKLPNKNIKDTLNIFEKFKKFNDIKPNTVIDLRIPNRIIIKVDKKENFNIIDFGSSKIRFTVFDKNLNNRYIDTVEIKLTDNFSSQFTNSKN